MFYVSAGLDYKGLVVVKKKTAKRLAKEFINPQFETLDEFMENPVIKYAISLMTDLQQAHWSLLIDEMKLRPEEEQKVFIEEMNELIQSLPQVAAMKKRMANRKIQGLKDLWALLFSSTEAKN